MPPNDQSPRRRSFLNGLIRHSVEILLFIVLSLIVIGVLVPKYSSNPRGARLTAAHVDLADLQTALAAFAKDNGRYPTITEGLDALIQNPGLPTWKGPYVRIIKNDPWGNPYRYTPPAAPPTLSSDGPDTLPNTPDDIKNP